MKFKCLVLPLTVSLLTCSCSAFKEDKDFLLVFGTDLVDSRGTSAFRLCASELDLKFIDSLLKNKDRYEDTLTYLNKNPVVRVSESVMNIHDMVEESEMIVINYSLNDVARHLDKAGEDIIYHENDFEEDISLFDYYLHNIIDCIYEIEEEVNVVLLSLFNPYEDAKINTYIQEFNTIIKNCSNRPLTSYIDMTEVELNNGSVATSEIHRIAKLLAAEGS